ncbi:protein DpdJ [Corallincola platygyrae]|uniref:Protein DpdJ n=1 Tax=Corallincola platygyrae TaxID=1193278 RepID=A0ABW4XLM9_9GAMM
MSLPLKVLHAALNRLEEQETALLAWGDTGGFFTREEVLQEITQACPDHAPDSVFMGLLKHAMLNEAPNPMGLLVYRTRMGEAVHLYRNLRQWFHGKPLEEARTLVSDFRFVRRPRSYPKRELVPAELLATWKSELPLSEQEQQLMQELLSPLDKFRLAGFQARATERIVKAWHYHNQSPRTSSGTIVCAGTGSGKTLSFYLPAMASLAADICQDPTPRVRILAIYPRKELLKDQFMETWSQCRKLDNYLLTTAGRKLRIGSLFGDTPNNVSQAKQALDKQGGAALTFDLLRCVNEQCAGKMQWPLSSMEQQSEVLACSVCGHKVENDEVCLTRQQLSDTAPDILFTTTEMLNQQLGNNFRNKLFGVGASQKGPTLVLLDEVHTYGGNTGAQTAYLLRRWMQRAYCRPHFVGLSATLADAEAFFAELVGANQQNVALVEPQDNEMLDEGAEYLLALRGDPVSQTALLSTSIQASMLTRRILDTPSQRSKGTWGTKSFVFTDDLDVNNRLYHQLSDAEGWKTSYRGATLDRAPLASLRGSENQSEVDPQLKIELGQDWRVAESIGHSLTADGRARVARTSSQDAGVDSEADIVVATASLEVGFNDPTVGAVIQHKAPRDVASYLQRKGRAGRSRTMRPWMLVVLSEFGRDRVAFQRYEELISPQVKRQGLPLHNSHIQKMQAAMATLDWLSQRMGRGAIWTLLNYPQNENKENERKALLSDVEKVLQPGLTKNALETYLQHALHLDEDALQRVLWSPPRSIMLEFLPTLRRYLTTDWAEYAAPWQALSRTRSPMPEFIPDALFSELNLPSLGVRLLRGRNNFDKWESLTFHQGLREFAPGRISKRYATGSNYEADWLVPEDFKPIANQVTEVDFEVSEAFGQRLTEDGNVVTQDGQSISVLKPSEVYTRPLEFTFNLTEKSNAQLKWQVAFNDLEQATPHSPPAGAWKRSLRDITFFTHQHMTPLEVVRYSTGSLASLRFKNGQQAHADFHWRHHGQTVGVGNRQWVDGTRLRISIALAQFRRILSKPEVLRGLRPVYFQSRVSELTRFEHDPFKANWAVECFLAALASELLSGTHDNIKAAIAFLASEDGCAKLQRIPGSLFQSEQAEDAGRQQQLQADLQHLLSEPEVQQELLLCAEALWQAPEQLVGFEAWAQKVLANTLAAATQQALCTLLPDVDEHSVVADALWSAPSSDAPSEQHITFEIWLTECEPGGSGVISRLSDAYHADPTQVLNILARSLKPGDYEQIDFDLFSLLEQLAEEQALQDAVADVRYAIDHASRKAANKQLHKQLVEAGFAVTHSFLTVLYSRLLRAGSSETTDVELLKLLVDWRQLEQQTGLEWNLNIAAHAIAGKESAGDVHEHFQMLCRYQGMLWPRGYTIRQSELNYYNPFITGHALTERMLGAQLFSEQTTSVEAQEPDWLAKVHAQLRQAGRVDLIVSRTMLSQITEIVTLLQVDPLDHLGLFLYPRIGSASRFQGNLVLRVELAEALQ